MEIIGITGTISSGKGAVVEILKEKGFIHYSASGFILKEIEKRGLEPIRSNYFLVGNDLRKTHSASYIIEQLYKEASASGQDSVIEAVRAVGELEYLRNQAHFHLIAVDANPKVRFERAIKRNRSVDRVTYEKFLEDEKNEMKSVNPSEMNLSYCIDHADFKLMNNGTNEELNKKVEEVLSKILKK